MSSIRSDVVDALVDDDPVKVQSVLRQLRCQGPLTVLAQVPLDIIGSDERRRLIVAHSSGLLVFRLEIDARGLVVLNQILRLRRGVEAPHGQVFPGRPGKHAGCVPPDPLEHFFTPSRMGRGELGHVVNISVNDCPVILLQAQGARVLLAYVLPSVDSCFCTQEERDETERADEEGRDEDGNEADGHLLPPRLLGLGAGTADELVRNTARAELGEAGPELGRAGRFLGGDLDGRGEVRARHWYGAPGLGKGDAQAPLARHGAGQTEAADLVPEPPAAPPRLPGERPLLLLPPPFRAR
mmetsp:Transcript_22603/g.66900  ORF Transcript_22603/g.66900 Transcript_22603/m.66900 type:complete len:297 (+) Transcript_22603:1105-1995(+)